MIDPRDVAAVGAALLTTDGLTTDGYGGRTYTLTGPETLTYDDVAARLSEATGRTIEFVNVPDPAARAALLQAGTPGWLADQLVTIYELLRQGAAAQTTDTVRALTGQPAGSLLAFAADHSEAFRPAQPSSGG